MDNLIAKNLSGLTQQHTDKKTGLHNSWNQPQMTYQCQRHRTLFMQRKCANQILQYSSSYSRHRQSPLAPIFLPGLLCDSIMPETTIIPPDTDTDTHSCKQQLLPVSYRHKGSVEDDKMQTEGESDGIDQPHITPWGHHQQALVLTKTAQQTQQ